MGLAQFGTGLVGHAGLRADTQHSYFSKTNTLYLLKNTGMSSYKKKHWNDTFEIGENTDNTLYCTDKFHVKWEMAASYSVLAT